MNRATLYGWLTLVLAGTFLAVTALSLEIVEATTGQRADILPVAGGVAVALSFRAVRRRAQVVVERLLPEREELALFFTDIVGSTELLAAAGDSHWRDLLEQYRATVRRELRRFGGTEMHVAGDCFVATFRQPVHAVQCAQTLAPALLALSLPSRFGVHLGSCEMRGEEVSGLAVWMAARVMSTAGAGEVVVSDAVRGAAVAAGFALEDMGYRTLKGLPGEWRLHAVVSAELRRPPGCEVAPR
jgi:class 3 adenylate cyclase